MQLTKPKRVTTKAWLESFFYGKNGLHGIGLNPASHPCFNLRCQPPDTVGGEPPPPWKVAGLLQAPSRCAGETSADLYLAFAQKAFGLIVENVGHVRLIASAAVRTMRGAAFHEENMEKWPKISAKVPEKHRSIGGVLCRRLACRNYVFGESSI